MSEAEVVDVGAVVRQIKQVPNDDVDDNVEIRGVEAVGGALVVED